MNWWRYSQYNICWLRYPGQRGVKFPPVPRSWHSVPDKLSGHSVPDDLSLTLCPGHAVLDKLSGHAVADRFCVDTRVSRKYMDDDSDQSRLTIGRRPGCRLNILMVHFTHVCPLSWMDPYYLMSHTHHYVAQSPKQSKYPLYNLTWYVWIRCNGLCPAFVHIYLWPETRHKQSHLLQPWQAVQCVVNRLVRSVNCTSGVRPVKVLDSTASSFGYCPLWGTPTCLTTGRRNYLDRNSTMEPRLLSKARQQLSNHKFFSINYDVVFKKKTFVDRPFNHRQSSEKY